VPIRPAAQQRAFADVLEQKRGRRLAIGARDADDFQTSRRMLVEIRREIGQRETRVP
jgi:hypothetical protein